jgi:hypothetical protein
VTLRVEEYIREDGSIPSIHAQSLHDHMRLNALVKKLEGTRASPFQFSWRAVRGILHFRHPHHETLLARWSIVNRFGLASRRGRTR